MSSDQEALEVGKLMLNVRDSRNKAAGLKSALENAADAYEAAAKMIRSELARKTGSGFTDTTSIERLKAGGDARALLMDYQTEVERLQSLEARKTELGV